MIDAKLSVVVPVYNVEQYLRQCIESILNQSMREIEVILVDDGSTDSSGMICDEYARKDKRIRVIHQKNSGPLLARKYGALECRCEYVTFVDGDDFIAPISFGLAESAMKKNIDIIVFNTVRYYSDTNQVKIPQDLPEGLYKKDKIERYIWPNMIWSDEKQTNGMFNALWNRVIKKELLLKAYQTYEYGNIHYGDDVAIVLPLYKYAESVEIKKEYYYFYRQRENGRLPGYITDPEFFDKVYVLYCHLRKVFQNDDQFTRQLELYYIKNVCLRRQVYKEPYYVRYLFPFDQVSKGDKIVLYGAGVAGRTYMEQLRSLNYCEVVLWVDRNYKNYEGHGISPVEMIKTVPYDKVVISIQDERVKDSIEAALTAIGVEQAKIIK